MRKYRDAHRNAHKHILMDVDENIKEDVIRDIMENDVLEYYPNVADVISCLQDDMYVKKGNRYVLTPSIWDGDISYQFRLYDGTLIMNVEEDTPLKISDVVGAVVDSGYSIQYCGNVRLEIDEEYYGGQNEILYYVYA